MKTFAAAVFAVVVLAAAAMKVIADGATGKAGGRFSSRDSLRRRLVIDRRTPWLLPPNSTADVLTVRAQVDAIGQGR